MYKILINKTNEIFCDPDESVLDALKKNKFNINYNCENGNCNSCKIKLLSGATSIFKNEQSLSNYDYSNNYILACCRKLNSDINIEINSNQDENSPSLLPAKIESIKHINNQLIELELRFPPKINFSFIAGQYVEIVNNETKRSYSIASKNKQNSNLNFYIKKYNEGVFSSYLFNYAKKNDLLYVNGPFGNFYLKKDFEETNLIFLATGTGIAPIRCILEQIEEEFKNYEFKNIYLIYGNRNQDELLWYPNFNNLKINFFPLFSNIEDEKKDKMYVQNKLIELNLNLEDSIVYACGSIKMINDAFLILNQNGLKESNFFADAFVKS